MSNVCIKLAERQDDLWKSFAAHTTEMVVTKTGRKMFPKLEYVVTGLEPDVFYAFVLQIKPVDDNRYKFSQGAWVPSGRAETPVEAKKIWHADGVMSGRQWMANPINFDRVKITNNSNDTCPSHIYLHSMHKYIPVLSIYESPSNSPFLMPSQTSQLVATSEISYTEFIAVTAYQNQSVTSLKIAHNPFAKGFREGSSDRKRSTPTSDESSPESTSQLSSPPMPKKFKTESPSPAESPSPMPTIPSMPFYMPPMNPLLYSRFNPFMLQQFAMAAAAAAAASGNGTMPFNPFGMQMLPQFNSFPTILEDHPATNGVDSS